MANVADMPYRLGRRPSIEDPRTLKLAAYTTPSLPPPPPTVNWLNRVHTWPMYANDRVGDCVPASCAHLTQAWTRYGGGEVTIPEPDVLAAYSTVAGYDPATGANDDGCVYLDMLNHWRQGGIGGHRITAYMQVDVASQIEVRTAIHLFGGLLAGIDMPLSAGTQTRRGETWRATGGPDGQAGSWGGHAVHVGAYNTRWLTCTTWGATQRLTAGFWGAYVREAYAVVGPDLLTRTGRSPLGLDLDALLADLQQITAT